MAKSPTRGLVIRLLPAIVIVVALLVIGFAQLDLRGQLMPGTPTASPGAPAFMPSSRSSTRSMHTGVSSSNQSSSSSIATCTPIPKTDLSIILSADTYRVDAGAPVRYTMTVKNNGLTMVPDAFTYLQREGMQYLGSDDGRCTTDGDQDVIRCRIGDLDPGAVTDITVTLQQPNYLCEMGGTNTTAKFASVTTYDKTVDINLQDNTSNVVVTEGNCPESAPDGKACMPIQFSDLSIALTQDKDKAKPGETIAYRLVVKNKGRGIISDAVARIPTEGMALVSNDDGRCIVDGDANSYVGCKVGELTPGSSTEIIVQMQMNSACPQTGSSQKTKFAYVESVGQSLDFYPQDNTSKFITTRINCGS